MKLFWTRSRNKQVVVYFGDTEITKLTTKEAISTSLELFLGAIDAWLRKKEKDETL